MSETWRPVPGYEGMYEVSDVGRVRSVDRVIINRRYGYSRHYAGRVLVLVEKRDIPSYYVVSLHKDGQQVQLVHHLVCLAFVGPMPKGMQVRHLNGDSLDNRLCNLSYGTPSENQLDNVRHGTHAHSRKTHCDSGHEFTDTNTRFAQGRRYCRACEARNARAYRRRRLMAHAGGDVE